MNKHFDKVKLYHYSCVIWAVKFAFIGIWYVRLVRSSLWQFWHSFMNYMEWKLSIQEYTLFLFWNRILRLIFNSDRIINNSINLCWCEYFQRRLSFSLNCNRTASYFLLFLFTITLTIANIQSRPEIRIKIFLLCFHLSDWLFYQWQRNAKNFY